MPKQRFLFFLISLLFIAGACDNYNKILKSNDVELKLAKAKEYYNEGNYYKALPLLDELVSIYRGREELEEIYLIYCYAHYGQGNYTVSAYNFKNYYTFYPNSKSAEEALFMAAKSYYQLSPSYELDQSETYDALKAFQLFLSTYPDSDKADEAKQMINELRDKLERKAIAAAMLYLKMESYQAAATAFSNVLQSYPNTEQADYLQYLVVKSNYLLAKNSILAKQKERFMNTVEAYNTLATTFPESKYVKEGLPYFRNAKDYLN